MNIGILTVSDRASNGTYIDETGPELVAAVLAWRTDATITTEIIPDEKAEIEAMLKTWSDDEQFEIVLTNGGTGLSARDLTPEATQAVIDREIPGITELMRAEGFKSTPLAALARQVAGQRGNTLIINLPGSVRGATESFAAIAPVLSHAVEMINS